MADRKTTDYINEAVREGKPRDKIESEMLSAGWTPDAAGKALADVLGAARADTSSAKPVKRTFLFAMILAVIAIVIASGIYLAYSYLDVKSLLGSEQVKESVESMIPEKEMPEFEEEPSVNMTGENDTVMTEGNGTAVMEANVSEEPEVTKVFSALPDPCADLNCTGIAVGTGGVPSILWTEPGYAVVWANYDGEKSTLYFARVGDDAAMKGAVVSVTEHNGESGSPSIASGTDGYAIVWPAENALYFIRTDLLGRMEGSAKNLNARPAVVESASVSWTGSGYGVAWADSSLNTYFAMLDAGGNPAGNETAVGLASSENPIIAWAKNEYGVAWVEQKGAGREIYLRRYDDAGELLSTIRVVNDYIFCDDLSMSWASNSYGMIYGCVENNKLTDMENKDVYFMRVYSTGGAAELVELDFGIFPVTNTETYSGNPSVILAEDHFGYALEDRRDGSKELYFGKLDPRTGTMREEPVRITHSTADSANPAIARGAEHYAMAWTEVSGEQMDVWVGLVD